mgnify:FL=1
MAIPPVEVEKRDNSMSICKDKSDSKYQLGAETLATELHPKCDEEIT